VFANEEYKVHRCMQEKSSIRLIYFLPFRAGGLDFVFAASVVAAARPPARFVLSHFAARFSVLGRPTWRRMLDSAVRSISQSIQEFS
jgi:hypothetical protein